VLFPVLLFWEVAETHDMNIGQVFLVAILFMVTSATPVVASTITAVPDAAFKDVPIQQWLDLAITAEPLFTVVPAIATLNVDISTEGGASCPNNIAMTPVSAASSRFVFWLDMFFHELSHISYCNSRTAFWDEGLAESGKDLLSQLVPGMAPLSSVALTDFKRTLDPASVIKSDEVDKSGGSFDYPAAAGILELVSRRNLRPFATLLSAIQPTGTAAELKKKYLDAADQAFPNIHGRKPSEYIGTSPILAPVPADGQYLNFLVTDDTFTTPIANSVAMINWHIREYKNGVGTDHYDGVVKWTMYGFDGKPSLTGIAQSGQNLTDTGYWIRTDTFADGAYPVAGCWVPPGAADCDSTKTSLQKTALFGVLHSVPDFRNGYTWIFANGGPLWQFGKFGGEKLSLVKDPGDPTQAISLPRLLGVRHNGMKEDVVISDGARNKRFSPPDTNPAFPTTYSQYLYWVEPTDSLAVISQIFGGTTVGPLTQVSPGQVATLWGVNDKLCVDWPPALQQFHLPLPTDYRGCTVHLLDDAGNDVLASLYFISGNQVNVQFPSPLANGTYHLVVKSGEGFTADTTSNPLVIKVVGLNPNYVQYASGSTPYLAVLHNDDYSLVTAANPARAGEFVQIYATGLGPTNPTVSAGQATMAPLITYPDVSINGVPAWVQWAGLHSQFPGLYQINVQIPANVAAAVTFNITSYGPDGSKQVSPFQVAQ
jgi:uncharacterized protein (TIGR03437 family)